MPKKFNSINNVNECDIITFESLNSGSSNDPKDQQSNSSDDEKVEVPSCFTLNKQAHLSRSKRQRSGSSSSGGKQSPSSSQETKRKNKKRKADDDALPATEKKKKRGRKKKSEMDRDNENDIDYRDLMRGGSAMIEHNAFYGRANINDLQLNSTHDLQELLHYLKDLHTYFINKAQRLDKVIEPFLNEACLYFENLEGVFVNFFRSTMKNLYGLNEQKRSFGEALSFINKRCTEVKVLKRTNDAKAKEVERLLEYVEKMQYAISCTHDIRRMPSALRPLVRPTFDYVPGSKNEVVCVVSNAPLPHAISVVNLLPSENSSSSGSVKDPQMSSEDILDAEMKEAMKEFNIQIEEDESPPPTPLPPITVVIQLGQEERDQSMAPSQRTKVLTQSMTRRFTSPLDSTHAHSATRAARCADAERLIQSYEATNKNRQALANF